MQKVSVVIPTYNGSHRVVHGIRSATSQTSSAIEIIVVDDGSTDDTANVAKAALARGGRPFEVIRQDNRGPSAARNTGWRVARGEWIQFLDDDDELALDKIALQMRLAEVAPASCDFVVSTWAKRHSASTLERNLQVFTPNVTDAHLEDVLRADNFLPFACGLVRKSALERTGGFNEQYRFIEDVDLQLRMIASGSRICVAPSTGPLFFYNARENSLSNSNRQAFVDGCVRNALLACDIARAKGQLSAGLKRTICDTLVQGALYYVGRDRVRFDQHVEAARAIDATYARKGGPLMALLVATMGWRRAELVAATYRTLRRPHGNG